MLVTLASLWLGYNAHVVRSRQQLLQRLDASGSLLLCLPRTISPALDPTRGTTRVRRWLGDIAILSIVMAEDRELQTVRDAFPEAQVALVEEFNPHDFLDPGGRRSVPLPN